MRLRLAPLIALSLIARGLASAQNFAIDWFTIDGGGGTSSGGVYTLSGTIGQPDAGTLSGGPYTLQGGFWPGALLIQTPDAPLLTAALSDQGAVISWPLPAQGWVLEQSADPSATVLSWTQVPFPYATNATHISVAIPSPAGTRLYRLRR